jgi:hypothetical protein
VEIKRQGDLELELRANRLEDNKPHSCTSSARITECLWDHQGWQEMGFWVWVFVGVCKNPIPSKRGKGVGFWVFCVFSRYGCQEGFVRQGLPPTAGVITQNLPDQQRYVVLRERPVC